jgi:hypothetical protein
MDGVSTCNQLGGRANLGAPPSGGKNIFARAFFHLPPRGIPANAEVVAWHGFTSTPRVFPLAAGAFK